MNTENSKPDVFQELIEIKDKINALCKEYEAKAVACGGSAHFYGRDGSTLSYLSEVGEHVQILAIVPAP